MGPYGNWDLCSIEKLGPFGVWDKYVISMNQPLEFVPAVKMILASYYCIEYSKLFDAHKKVKAKKKVF